LNKYFAFKMKMKKSKNLKYLTICLLFFSFLFMIILLHIVVTKQKKDKSDNDFVEIDEGIFKMGSNSLEVYFAKTLCNFCDINTSLPLHDVKIIRFKIGKFEITNSEFSTFLNDYKADTIKEGEYQGETIIYDCSQFKNQWGVKRNNGTWTPVVGYEMNPVVYVSWYGATEYCKWLSEKTKRKFRLPTEAEWEYAAKANCSFHFSGSNIIDEVAWYDRNSGDICKVLKDYGTHQVGLKKPNDFGLFDMCGNVWEWCSDWCEPDYYEHSEYENPKGPKLGTFKTIRGGAWYGNAWRNRITHRAAIRPYEHDNKTGFRVVQEI